MPDVRQCSFILLLLMTMDKKLKDAFADMWVAGVRSRFKREKKRDLSADEEREIRAAFLGGFDAAREHKL